MSAANGAALPLPGQYLPDYQRNFNDPRQLGQFLQDLQDNFEAITRGVAGSAGVATVTYLNSWVDAGAPYAGVGLWKQNDGTVHCTGVLTKAGLFASQAVFNVPAGFRPSAASIFLTAQSSTTPSYGFARMELATSGDMSLVAGSLGPVTVQHLSVSGLTWRAA